MYFLLRYGLAIVLLLLNPIFSFTIKAQTILVQPYLQNASASSMVIMWETDVNTESIVQYGLTQNLGSSTAGTSIVTLGNSILHTVSIIGLSPATKYN